jgi:hypothetical protein
VQSNLASVAAAAGIAAWLWSPATAFRVQEAALPPLPLELTAFAVNMSTVQRPASTAVLRIRITRWSTPEERERLITTAIEKGQDALLRELQRMPDHGRMSIPAWTGPDPHNARLGWELHYAFATPGEDGGLRIGIATDRYIGFWEARNQPRTIDYPFTLIEMRLDQNGRGVGKMAVATKIEFDRNKKQMVLENYASEPVRLNEIKIDKR